MATMLCKHKDGHLFLMGERAFKESYNPYYSTYKFVTQGVLHRKLFADETKYCYKIFEAMTGKKYRVYYNEVREDE